MVLLHAEMERTRNSSIKIFMLKMDSKPWAQLKSPSPCVQRFKMRALLTSSPLCPSAGRDESRERRLRWGNERMRMGMLYISSVYFCAVKYVEIKEHAKWTELWEQMEFIWGGWPRRHLFIDTVCAFSLCSHIFKGEVCNFCAPASKNGNCIND